MFQYFILGASGDHVFYKCYPANLEDFSSSGEPLDTWVFDEVKVRINYFAQKINF